MTTPYIPGLDGPDNIDPEQLIDLLRENLDAKNIELIVAKAKVSDLTAALDRRSSVEGLSHNDRMANVCKLAGAALSHLNYIPPFKTSEPYELNVLMCQQMQAAIDLLKPLSTGVHDTHECSGLREFCYATDIEPVYNHELECEYGDDPSMGDDPWNEWGTWPIDESTPIRYTGKPWQGKSTLLDKFNKKQWGMRDWILNPPDDMPEIISAGNKKEDGHEIRPPYMKGKSAESMMWDRFKRQPTMDELYEEFTGTKRMTIEDRVRRMLEGQRMHHEWKEKEHE